VGDNETPDIDLFKSNISL
jgi:hypothetical protein